MSGPDLHDRLADAEIPDEAGARARGWRVVQAAYDDRPRTFRPARTKVRTAWALAAAAGVLALVLTPAGAKVVDALKSATGIGEKNAQPALRGLPAPGQLLVGSAKGPWVVQSDGAKRLIGDFNQAGFSPHGLYLAVTTHHQVAAVTPTGEVHWTLPESGRVLDPRWSPSGIRVAFLSGHALHVSAGDGTSDVVIDRNVAKVAPAWRPVKNPTGAAIVTGPRTNVLAYVDQDRRIVLIDTDTGRVLARSTAAPLPSKLTWSDDGRRLLAVTRRGLRTYTPHLQEPTVAGFARNQTIRDAEFVPETNDVVATVQTRSHGRTRTDVRYGRPDVEAFLHRVLYSGAGRLSDVQPSPDGRWILAAWPAADQWLFISPSGDRTHAVKNISEQFDPGAASPASFPQIDGWCCSP